MWRRLMNRRVLQAALVVGALLAVALWPRATAVDAAQVIRGPLVVTVDEEGETHVHHRFVVSAPVSGRLSRITLEPGDTVTRGTTAIAHLAAEVPALIDARSRAEAEAAVASARGALGRARAGEQRARTALTQATADLSRERELSSAGLTTRQALEARETAVATAQEDVNAAAFAVAAAESDLQRAEVRLRPSRLDGPGRDVTVTAPVDGVVLRRFHESEQVVAAGEPLVEIGDPSHVEIVADLLSTDAVKVKPGMRVSVEQWGGDTPLAGRVTRVEPAGFTKVSALGVEEQRVNVIIDFDDDRQAWAAMGDAYRVEVRIAIWSADDVVQVPTGALFRAGDRWAVFVVDGGRARRRTIEIGQRNGTSAQVTSGLEPGATVVLHPPDSLVDGARITPAAS
ncbi:MAG: efflux RND transporter periplasmic adaptor subunit [Vicinamibacterales bacterium]